VTSSDTTTDDPTIVRATQLRSTTNGLRAEPANSGHVQIRAPTRQQGGLGDATAASTDKAVETVEPSPLQRFLHRKCFIVCGRPKVG
jgi:hypothetical protein